MERHLLLTWFRGRSNGVDQGCAEADITISVVKIFMMVDVIKTFFFGTDDSGVLKLGGNYMLE